MKIKARRLEAWLADWFEGNSICPVKEVAGDVMAYENYLDGSENPALSISRLAEDLAVALAEAGFERD